MTEAPQAPAAGVPLHLRIIGILALLWNAIGCWDYVVTQTHNEAALEGHPQEMLDFIYSQPAWVDAAWAFGVWGGLLGSLLLIMRRGWAVTLFSLSWLGAVASMFNNFVLEDGIEAMGGGGKALVMPVVIITIATFLVIYSKGMRQRGYLC